MSEETKATDNGKGQASVPAALHSARFHWTARDQYASAAMAALIPTIANSQRKDRLEEIATQAYEIADAMLSAAGG